jgi:hypothetical protein
MLYSSAVLVKAVVKFPLRSGFYSVSFISAKFVRITIPIAGYTARTLSRDDLVTRKVCLFRNLIHSAIKNRDRTNIKSRATAMMSCSFSSNDSVSNSTAPCSYTMRSTNEEKLSPSRKTCDDLAIEYENAIVDLSNLAYKRGALLSDKVTTKNSGKPAKNLRRLYPSKSKVNGLQDGKNVSYIFAKSRMEKQFCPRLSSRQASMIRRTSREMEQDSNAICIVSVSSSSRSQRSSTLSSYSLDEAQELESRQPGAYDVTLTATYKCPPANDDGYTTHTSFSYSLDRARQYDELLPPDASNGSLKCPPSYDDGYTTHTSSSYSLEDRARQDNELLPPDASDSTLKCPPSYDDGYTTRTLSSYSLEDRARQDNELLPPDVSDSSLKCSPAYYDGGCTTLSPHIEIEIAPSVFVPVRDGEETGDAIRQGNCVNVYCFSCATELLCISDAKYVLCPDCNVVSPVDLPGKRHGIGVGLEMHRD